MTYTLKDHVGPVTLLHEHVETGFVIKVGDKFAWPDGALLEKGRQIGHAVKDEPFYFDGPKSRVLQIAEAVQATEVVETRTRSISVIF